MSSTIIAVRVIPNANRTRCVGWVDDAFKIRLQERPEKGRANKALVNFLAKQLSVQRSCISWVSGENARQKLLRVEGLTELEISQRLAPT